jgi:26S proteasome regulatory subunit N5
MSAIDFLKFAADKQNIRVIAAYYHRITLQRLTELLDLPPLTTERTLCKLVTDKIIYARIDRPKGIVTFKPQTDTVDILNSWTADIDKMLGLVEKTSHLVSKVSPMSARKNEELMWQEYAMHDATKGKKVKA